MDWLSSRFTSACRTLRQGIPWLYEMLALVDGVRIGDARVRGVAAELLRARLAEVPA